ncbi:MAG: hypothetical protein Q9160_007178 [Pyrenula sp. 1 TL-2023]
MSGHKHFDGTAYWRQAFQKSESAQAQLLDKLYEMEQERDAHLNSVDVHQTTSAVKGKRKRGTEPTQPRKANSQAKRRAASSQTALPSFEDTPSLPNHEYVKGTHNTTKNTFLRQVFRLRQSLNKRKLDVNIITIHFCEICASMIRLLEELFQSCNAKSVQAKASAKATTRTSAKANSIDAAGLINVLQTAFPSLHLAIAKMNTIPNQKTRLDTMVVAMTELFHETLNGISELFTFQVQDFMKADKRATRSKPSGLQATEHQSGSGMDTCKDTIQQITNFLQHMFYTLDLEHQTSNELLEAYGCVLLDHIGQCLSLQVFAQDIEHVPNNAHPRFVQPKVLKSLENCEIEIRQQAVLQQSQCLVHLLRQFMAFITDRESLMSTKSPPLLGVPKDPLFFHQSFADRIRSKLQNTLMQGVFGEDDLAFRDSLKIPEATALRNQTSEACDSGTLLDKPEWFIGQLWETLGWNILEDLARDPNHDIRPQNP